MDHFQIVLHAQEEAQVKMKSIEALQGHGQAFYEAKGAYVALSNLVYQITTAAKF